MSPSPLLVQRWCCCCSQRMFSMPTFSFKCIIIIYWFLLYHLIPDCESSAVIRSFGDLKDWDGQICSSVNLYLQGLLVAHAGPFILRMVWSSYFRDKHKFHLPPHLYECIYQHISHYNTVMNYFHHYLPVIFFIFYVFPLLSQFNSVFPDWEIVKQ